MVYTIFVLFKVPFMGFLWYSCLVFGQNHILLLFFNKHIRVASKTRNTTGLCRFHHPGGAPYFYLLVSDGFNLQPCPNTPSGICANISNSKK